MTNISNRKDGFYTIEGKLYPSVTTILKALSKPALIPWACIQGWKIGRKYRIDSTSQLLQYFRKISDDAKARGTDSHDLVQSYFRTGKIPKTESLYKLAFENFIKDFKVKPLHIEFIIRSDKYMYAGTGDLHAVVDDNEVVIDFKTNKKANIYQEVELQMIAYSNALFEMGLTKTVLPTMVVSLGLDGIYKTKKFEDTNIQKFLNVYEVWKWMTKKL